MRKKYDTGVDWIDGLFVVVIGVFMVALNLALLAAGVFVVVKVLQATGVI